MGRYQKTINWEQFEFLCQTPNATQKSLAEALGVCEDTLHLRFKEKYEMNFSDFSGLRRQGGQTLFEGLQLQKAFKGSERMLIHLGKVWYGQKDAETEVKSVPREEILLLEDKIIKLKEEIRKFKNESKPETGTELQSG